MDVQVDIKFFRDNKEQVEQAFARRGEKAVKTFNKLLEVDKQRREILPRIEKLRSEQKAANSEIAKASKQLRGNGITQTEFEEIVQKPKSLAKDIKELGILLHEVEECFELHQLRLPNLPFVDTPDKDKVIKQVGEKRIDGLDVRKNNHFIFKAPEKALDHLQVAGEKRIDMQRGANLAGSRFAYLKGDLVMLELALVQWVMNKLNKKAFVPVIPPALSRKEALYGTGFLPDTESQIYTLENDDLYLTGTSEVALAYLHQNEILDFADLPIRYAGFSSCFRREAGTAGKDTTGIFRVHQFDKVEMFSFVAPENAQEEHQLLLEIEEEILTELGLPYQVINIAINDLGPSAAQKFDCEVWLPEQEKYRELTSTSNTTDFQTRRLNTRLRRVSGEKTEKVFTLNGTAIAVGRTLVALLEHGQQKNGEIVLPGCLKDFGAPGVLPAAKDY